MSNHQDDDKFMNQGIIPYSLEETMTSNQDGIHLCMVGTVLQEAR